MNTYLLTWNPKRWVWEDLNDCIKKVQNEGFCDFRWSCGRSKRIQKDDRIFMIRLGEEPKGIFASGRAINNAYSDTHWDKDLLKEGKTSCFVKVRFDTLINPEEEEILYREKLHITPFDKVHWDTQLSGILIADEIASKLELEWKRLIERKKLYEDKIKINKNEYLPEEIRNDIKYFEGSVKQIVVNVYERNLEARRKCLICYGFNCFVCEFNFEEMYGKLGEGFIHVHHLKPLSEIGSNYELNPIKDLRPICPNCHAMLHKKNPPYSIIELKEIIKETSRAK